jgi:hypothetical protein
MMREPANQFLYVAVGLMKRIVLLPRSFRLKMFRLKGKAAGTCCDFTLYYIGERETIGYFRRSYFSQVVSEDMGIIPLGALRSELRRLRTSGNAVIVEVNRLLDFYVPQGGFQSFSWIKQKAVVEGSLVQSRRRKIEDVYGRKVRNRKYIYKLTKEDRAVERFYHELHLPYISRKYQETTHVRSLQELRSAARQGFLMEVFEEDRLVSGVVCHCSRDTVRVLASGIAPDYEYNLRGGAHSACEYFILQWSQENAIKTIDYLRSRPNLNDGVFEYKRKWGALPVKDLWPHTSLWIFAPKGAEIPQIVGKQLVWRQNGFVTLEECLQQAQGVFMQ